MPTSPNSIITAQAPYAAALSLAAVTACATRAPTPTASLAAANIFQLAAPTTNGLRIDRIRVKGSSSSITATTAAQTVLIFLWDGTTAWLFDEVPIAALAPSTSIPSFLIEQQYVGLVIPATWAVYSATTVTTTAATTALDVILVGATL